MAAPVIMPLMAVELCVLLFIAKLLFILVEETMLALFVVELLFSEASKSWLVTRMSAFGCSVLISCA